jgi:hypothetical protein
VIEKYSVDDAQQPAGLIPAEEIMEGFLEEVMQRVCQEKGAAEWRPNRRTKGTASALVRRMQEGISGNGGKSCVVGAEVSGVGSGEYRLKGIGLKPEAPSSLSPL